LSADGHIVDKQYGCGAHSDTPGPAGTGSPAYEPYDDGVLDVTEKPPEAPAAAAEPAPEPPEPQQENQPEMGLESPPAAPESPSEPVESPD